MMYILLGIVLGVVLYYKIIKRAKYWEDRNVPHEPSLPILGNMGSAVLKKKHLMDITMELYQKYPDQRFVGFMQFTRPILLIRDIELIKQSIKDSDYFHDHFHFGKTDPLLSKSLVDTFTNSKIRSMHQLMAECAEKFVGHFRGKEQVAVEMKDMFSRFATDVIATTAGLKKNSLNEPNNSFLTMGGRLTKAKHIHFVKTIILSKLVILGDLIGLHLFSTDVTNFFRSLIKENITKKEKGQLKYEGFATVEESQIGKNTKQMELTEDDIAAQAMFFLFAGFHTASSPSCFLAYELAVYPEIQKRLQTEIDAVNQKEKVSYETLLSMKYLDQVVCETLRLWPPVFQTERVCTKEYIIEPTKSNETRFVINEGASVLIPVAAIHRDPQFYPEPNNFDPERFSDENISKIVPETYMPFGIGPQNCIGSKFALLEIKTLFFHLLTKFDIVAIDETQIPLTISPRKGFRLGLKPRKVTFY